MSLLTGSPLLSADTRQSGAEMDMWRAGRRLCIAQVTDVHGWHKSNVSELLLLLADTRLDTDVILKVEQWGFLMDWLWDVKVELVPLVCYPSAAQVQPMWAPCKKKFAC